MQGLVETLRNLGGARLALIGGVAVGLLAFFIFLTSRLGTVDNSLLYADLSTSDSAKIVGQLESMGVPYQLQGGGSSIMVPSDQVLRLRMTMAQEGLPGGGSVGYEIFDNSDNLGATNFVQNVNLVRALEGELSRTIKTLSQVDEARVHLVLPKRELFSRRKQEPSASVVVKTRGAGRIPKTQILSIQQLVAAAVPGLVPERISIIDDRGRLLARAGDGQNGDLGGVTIEENKRAYEQHLVRTIEELLEQSVGLGKVRARVTADMDYDRISTNSETYDPDGQVVRSTQTVEESENSSDAEGQSTVSVGNNLPDANAVAGGADRSSSNAARTEETVNFEISKTTRTHVRETGVVRRLSVAVMVDGSYSENEDGDRVYNDRSPEELEKLTKLVESAIGYDPRRGDKLELVNMRFNLTDLDVATDDPLFGLTKNDYFRIGEMFVLAIVGILVILLVVRPLVARTLDALPSALEAAKEASMIADQSDDSHALPGPSGTGVSALDDDEDTLVDVEAIEGRVKASTLKKIAEIVERHPEETVGILRQWMYAEN